MKKSASEIINNLESRVARLERSAMGKDYTAVREASKQAEIAMEAISNLLKEISVVKANRGVKCETTEKLVRSVRELEKIEDTLSKTRDLANVIQVKIIAGR
tara:strand:- start:329 stop:634 length:306 start_codon:yes stop_codon:yes gene_type:complete